MQSNVMYGIILPLSELSSRLFYVLSETFIEGVSAMQGIVKNDMMGGNLLNFDIELIIIFLDVSWNGTAIIGSRKMI